MSRSFAKSVAAGAITCGLVFGGITAANAAPQLPSGSDLSTGQVTEVAAAKTKSKSPRISLARYGDATQHIQAGKSTAVSVKVSNTGTATLKNATVLISATSGATIGTKKVKISSIKPGSFKKVTVNLRLKENAKGRAEVKFVVTAKKVSTASISTQFRVTPAPNPDFINSLFRDDHKIPFDPDQLGDDGIPMEGAASVEREGDHKNSPYYTALDFYNMKPTANRTLLKKFKTQQQATEWTCGLTSIKMVMEHMMPGQHGEVFELDLARMRDEVYDVNSTPRRGSTKLNEMERVFDRLGGYDYISTRDYVAPGTPGAQARANIPEEVIPELLKQGIPVMIGWDEWGGHWQVAIGYDNMGTEVTQDDILILADPYDTTDHNQDGYVVESWERFFYNWKNTWDVEYKSGVFIAAWPEDTDVIIPGVV